MRPIRAGWVLVLTVALAAPAFAGDLELSPFLQYGVNYESNLFSETHANQRADAIRQGSVGILANWPISRQRLVVSAQASRFRYHRFNQLNHSEYKGRAAWKYQVGPLVYGSASYRQERYLENFANRSTRQADFIRERAPRIDSYLKVTPDWRVHARAGRLQLQHSLNSQQRFDRRETRGLLALQYTDTPGSVFGAGAEVVDGEFPARAPGDPLSRTFFQDTPFVHIDWKYSGISRFYGRLGYTQRNNSGGSDGRDFSGITGRLGYVRTVSGDTRLSLKISRQIYSVDNVDANYVRDTGAQLKLTWNYDPKLDLTAHIDRHRQDYQTLSGAKSRHDTVNDFGSELTLKPYRTVALIFNASVIQQRSNVAGETYNDVIGGVALRLTLNPQPDSQYQ